MMFKTSIANPAKTGNSMLKIIGNIQNTNTNADTIVQNILSFQELF